jgi:catechol 2,3-dioxygenase-like lactoylglutathione lyase family enzyme
MIIKRIVPNISATDLSKARRFYGDLLGLETGMDLGWIVTFVSFNEMTTPQVSIAIEGGSGNAVPDLSIEVDDLDEAVHRIQAAGFAIEYGPITEEWGVRRFYVRDPFGKLLNILSHTATASK